MSRNFLPFNVLRPTLNYPLCEDPDHNNEQMNFVCLERKCKNKGLICSLCRQVHPNHNVVPLKKLLEQLSPALKDGNDRQQHELACLEDLQSTYFSMLAYLKAAVERLSNTFRVFEQDLIRNYSTMKEKIIDQSLATRNIGKILEMLEDSDDCLEVLKIEMKNIADLIILDKATDKYVVEYFPDAIVAEFKMQEQLVDGTLKSLCGVFDENMNALKYTLTKNQADFIPTYKFSPTLKPKNIALLKKNLGAKQNETNNADLRFALIEPCLSLNRPSKITFLVQKCFNWIGIGICIKQAVTGKNFKFAYNSVGHGSYLASSNGYIWSHSLAEDNMKNKSFNFTTNDLVTVEFDPLARKVIYSKGKDRYEQVVTLDYSKDTIHFCANLCSQNDEVRIRNETLPNDAAQ